MNIEQKPALFTTIAVLTLLSGIVNLFWGYVASVTALSTFIGVVCLPITILPTILGLFEIVYAAKLFSTQPQRVQPSQPLAVFQISTLIYGNIFSVVVGILNLIFFNDPTVRDYFAKINGVQVFAPAPVVPDREPAIDPVLPEPVEDSDKPKRIRKVAGK